MIERLPVQLGALITAGLIAGSIALVSMGAIGGVAMAAAPEFTFGLVANVVCPEGTSLKYYSVHYSYHEPGESEPHVECVGKDGAGKDVLLPAILTVLGLTFLAVFVPVFIPLAVLALIVPQKVANMLRKRNMDTVTFGGFASPARVDITAPTQVIYQGQVYTNVDEMPPEVRQAYQKAMSVFADADHDGIPDIFQGRAMPRPGLSATPQTDDIAQKLQKLRGLRDAGLITDQEYEAKKAEILSNF